MDEGLHQQFGALMGRRPQHRQQQYQPADASTGFAEPDHEREAVNKARSAALKKMLMGARTPSEQQPTRRYQQYHSVQ